MDYDTRTAATLQEISSALSRVDTSALEAVLDAIDSANRVFVLGIGREGLASKAFAMRLTHYGKETHWGWDDTTPNVSPGDLFVMSSGNGNIGHLHYVAELVKEAGATLLVVTAYPDAQTPSLADIVIRIPAHTYGAEDRDVVPSTQPMGNLFEQSLGLFYDLLFGLLIERSGTTEEVLVARHRNFQ